VPNNPLYGGLYSTFKEDEKRYANAPYTTNKKLAELFMEQRPKVFHVEKIKFDIGDRPQAILLSSYDPDTDSDAFELKIAEFNTVGGDTACVITTAFEVRDAIDRFVVEIASDGSGEPDKLAADLHQKYRKLLDRIGYTNISRMAFGMLETMMQFDDEWACRTYYSDEERSVDIAPELVAGLTLELFMNYERGNFVPCTKYLSQKRR
jgi:hypothetical protein